MVQDPRVTTDIVRRGISCTFGCTARADLGLHCTAWWMSTLTIGLGRRAAISDGAIKHRLGLRGQMGISQTMHLLDHKVQVGYRRAHGGMLGRHIDVRIVQQDAIAVVISGVIVVFTRRVRRAW